MRAPLIGRGDELARLRAALREPGVVTVVGPGGAGKTRLLREVAGDVVALAEVRDPELLVAALAAAVGCGPDPAALGAALAHRGRAVLALDNLEQLGVHAGRLVSTLATAAPALTIAATSRTPLQVDGERLVPVGPLPPADALALLRERLERRAPGRTFVDADLAGLAAALDHLPLALELVAARLPALGVAGVRAHLGRRLDFLADAGPDRPAHHRSLRTAVEGSWALLSEAERQALRRVCLLPDPLELGDLAAFADPDLPLRLVALVDAGLVRVDDDGAGNVAHHPYETVRAFVRDQLTDSDPLHAEVTAALCALAEPLTAALHGPGVGDAVRQLLRLRPALLEAAERAWRAGRHQDHARLVLALDRVLHQHGPSGWRLRALHHVRDSLPPTDARHAEATLSLVMTGGDLRDERVLDFAPALLTRSLAARRDTALAKLLYDQGRLAEAGEVAEALVARLPPTDQRVYLGAWWITGGIRTTAGRLSAAREAYERGLAVARDAGSPLDEALFLGQLGSVLLDLGHDGALPALHGAVELLARHQDFRRSVWLMRLAELHLDGGRAELGLRTADEATAVMKAAGQFRFDRYAEALRARALEAVGRRPEAAAAWALALAPGGHPLLEATALAWHGRWLADQGRTDEARAALARSAPLYPAGSKLAALPEVCGHHVTLALARAERDAGRDPEPLRARVHAFVQALEPAAHEVRAARHQLAERLATDRGDADDDAGITTAADHGWVVVRGQRTDLSTRHAIRRVWRALATAHPTGEALGVDALFAAGWPGERAAPDAARDRVYHAIGTLRRAGLQDALERSERGWRLRPDLPLRVG